MRLLAFSDLHTDLGQAKRLAESSAQADVVVGVGDFASVHSGLEDTIEALRTIETPAVLVPGNNETDEALREACADWSRAVVLHGEGTEIDGVPFFGLGAGVPVTPWDWSFDLTEEAAAEMLRHVPKGACSRFTPRRAATSTWAAPESTWAAKRCSARSRASGLALPSAATFTRAGARNPESGPPG